VLDHIVAEAIRKDLSGQGWDRDPRALPLKYVAEVFKVRVAAAHAGLPQFEGGDVGLAEDLVVRVHGAADTVRAWVLDLAERVWLEGGCLSKRKQGEQEGRQYFYLEEVLGGPVDFFEALLARIWHGLHGCGFD